MVGWSGSDREVLVATPSKRTRGRRLGGSYCDILACWSKTKSHRHTVLGSQCAEPERLPMWIRRRWWLCRYRLRSPELLYCDFAAPRGAVSRCLLVCKPQLYHGNSGARSMWDEMTRQEKLERRDGVDQLSSQTGLCPCRSLSGEPVTFPTANPECPVLLLVHRRRSFPFSASGVDGRINRGQPQRPEMQLSSQLGWMPAQLQ